MSSAIEYLLQLAKEHCACCMEVNNLRTILRMPLHSGRIPAQAAIAGMVCVPDMNSAFAACMKAVALPNQGSLERITRLCDGICTTRIKKTRRDSRISFGGGFAEHAGMCRASR